MPLSLRSKRNSVEGWSVDGEAEAITVSRRERLANNTPLWFFCAVAVVAVCVGMIIFLGGNNAEDAVINKMRPGTEAKGYYQDEAHQAFVERFVAMERKRGVSTQAEFVSNDEFNITVPGDVGYDEIAYMSRFAALGIKRRFGNGAIIYAYSQKSKTPQPRLTSTTQWSAKEGNFVTKSEGAVEAE